MIGLALLMLFGKRGKHLLLLSGICSSTIMMVLGMSLGFGVLNISYGTVDDIRSPIWIVAPMVQQAPGPILPPVNPINAATAEIARKRYDKGLANYLDVTRQSGPYCKLSGCRRSSPAPDTLAPLI